MLWDFPVCGCLDVCREQERGCVLHVAGADLMDGTPIYDIKPYIPYADCRPEASGGFTDQTPRRHLQVDFPREWLERVPENKRAALCAVLENDPRPSYQHDAGRVYGFGFCRLRGALHGGMERFLLCAASGRRTERERRRAGQKTGKERRPWQKKDCILLER